VFLCAITSDHPEGVTPARCTGGNRLANSYLSVLVVVAEVHRARLRPGLWPGPRRQARWVGSGLRGQRRAEGASRVSGMRSTVEAGGADPDNARRSGSLAGTCLRRRRNSREADGWSSQAGAAPGGYGGHRTRPVTGAAGRGSSACPQGFRPKGTTKAAAPPTVRSRS
jgi:hypothetical protein